MSCGGEATATGLSPWPVVSFQRQSQCDNRVEENAQYFEQLLLRLPLNTPSPNAHLIHRKYVPDIHEAPSTKRRNGNSRVLRQFAS